MVRKIIGFVFALSSVIAFAASDEPDLSDWDATGYYSGWFTYAVKKNDAGVRIGSSEQFLLSRHYSSPVRKVVLKVSCDSASPTRTLCVKPFVGGKETSDGQLIRYLNAPEAKDAAQYVHFDWDSSLGVDALRICLGGSGSSGNWIVSEIHVFYGEKSADEDEIVRDLVKLLPAPSAVEIIEFTKTSLCARAGEVEFAGGYEFEVHRLLGEPRAESREDFADAPAVSQRWTLTQENATLGSYTSASYCDNKTSNDGCSLKITSKTSKREVVRVELTSPVLDLPARECSFMYKVYAGGKSDEFKLYGTDGNGGEWRELFADKPENAEKKYANVMMSDNDGIRQVKLVFTAYGDDFANAAIDAFSIVCGGDEERLPVGGSGALAKNEYALGNLETGRYAIRARALASAGSEYGASAWSDEAIVDLSWADLVAGLPGGVVCQSAGGSLRVSWNAAENAAYYRVTVSTIGVPSEIVAEVTTADTAVDVPLSDLGEYTVGVTAFSPGGKSSASAAPIQATLELAPLGKVTATAVDRVSLSAKWAAVPLAEGYRVRVFRLGGEMAEFASDYSRLPEVWPEGWTHFEYLTRTYSGPFPKIDVRGCWIATCAYPMPITKATYSFKSHASQALSELTRIAVDVSSSEEGDDWRTDYAVHASTTAKQTIELAIPYGDGVRRLRFRFLFDDQDPANNPALEFGSVSVVCGQETRSEVASLRTEATSATVGGLPQDGRFAVEVTPLPSQGDGLSSVSQAVDLSLMKPRDIEPVAFSDFALSSFAEDFACLDAMAKETSLKELKLSHWQFYKGDDAADTLKFTSSGKATAGGAYAMASAADASNRAIGTLSTSSYGCALGIAFTNDLNTVVESPKLKFTSVQRSFKNAAKSYVLEYLVTGGEYGIDVKDGWTAIDIPVTAPFTAETCGDKEEYRNAVGPLEFSAAVPPGGVLLLRWRDEKGASSPLMGIDDIEFSCSARPRSMVLIMR